MSDSNTRAHIENNAHELHAPLRTPAISGETIKSDEIKAVIATLPAEQREVVNDYLERLAGAVDDIQTLVSVSRLALDSLRPEEGDSIGKTLFTATCDIYDLHEHLSVMIAEGRDL